MGSYLLEDDLWKVDTLTCFTASRFSITPFIQLLQLCVAPVLQLQRPSRYRYECCQSRLCGAHWNGNRERRVMNQSTQACRQNQFPKWRLEKRDERYKEMCTDIRTRELQMFQTTANTMTTVIFTVPPPKKRLQVIQSTHLAAQCFSSRHLTAFTMSFWSSLRSKPTLAFLSPLWSTTSNLCTDSHPFNTLNIWGH